MCARKMSSVRFCTDNVHADPIQEPPRKDQPAFVLRDSAHRRRLTARLHCQATASSPLRWRGDTQENSDGKKRPGPNSASCGETKECPLVIACNPDGSGAVQRRAPYCGPCRRGSLEQAPGTLGRHLERESTDWISRK